MFCFVFQLIELQRCRVAKSGRDTSQVRSIDPCGCPSIRRVRQDCRKEHPQRCFRETSASAAEQTAPLDATARPEEPPGGDDDDDDDDASATGAATVAAGFHRRIAGGAATF